RNAGRCKALLKLTIARYKSGGSGSEPCRIGYLFIHDGLRKLGIGFLDAAATSTSDHQKPHRPGNYQLEGPGSFSGAELDRDCKCGRPLHLHAERIKSLDMPPD